MAPDDAPLDPPGAERVYRILARMARADGDLDPAERALLEQYRVRLEIAPAKAAELERDAIAGVNLIIGAGALERNLMLAGVLEVLAADGVIEEQEEHRLFELGRALGLPRQQVEEAIRRRCAGLVEGGGEAPSPNGVRRIYMALARLASCDGQVAAPERARLESFRIRHGIPPEEAAALRARADCEDDLRVGKHPSERWVLMDELVALAAADGALAPDEQRRVLTFAAAVGLAPDEVFRRMELAVGAKRGPLTPTPGAPPPGQGDPEFARRIAELDARLIQVDREHGAYHERHLPILMELSSLHELCGNQQLALATQERLIETGTRLVIDAERLARDWHRLARLYRAVGRQRDGENADAKGRALVRGSSSGDA